MRTLLTAIYPTLKPTPAKSFYEGLRERRRKEGASKIGKNRSHFHHVGNASLQQRLTLHSRGRSPFSLPLSSCPSHRLSRSHGKSRESICRRWKRWNQCMIEHHPSGGTVIVTLTSPAGGGGREKRKSRREKKIDHK